MIRTRLATLVAILSLPFGPLPTLQAAPGDLDLSLGGFGTNGVVNTSGVSTAMAVAPDGKIVTVGKNGTALVVDRYLPDGTRDLTFAGFGRATLSNPAWSMSAHAVAIQPDGKIVVAGLAGNSSDDFFVARIRTNGTADPAFGSLGYVAIDFNTQADQANAVVIQPDGKIVVAGTARVGGDDDFAVTRLTSNGSLDPSFSGDGRLTIGFGGDDECDDAALQEDGKLVLVGSNAGLTDRDFAVARLLSNGTLDDSFDFDGKLTTGLGDTDHAKAVAIQSDGKIVVVGTRVGSGGARDGVLARYLSSGALDTSLDGDGKMTVASDGIYDVLVQPDGRILIAGEHYSLSVDLQIAVYRLDPNGNFDPTFDDDGRAFFDLGTKDIGRGLALLPDGRILVLGSTGSSTFTQDATWLARLWQNGNRDSGGHQVLGFPESFLGAGSKASASGLAVQPDGKSVVVGTLTNAAGTESDFALARFNTDGEFDASFGTGGRATLSFHNFDIARAVALQPDGKIVVVGNAGQGNGINFLIARFNSNGTLDPTFGFFGYNVLDFAGGADFAQAVTIAPDGKIVVAGTVFNGVDYVYGVARFTTDGVADPSFDLDGKQTRQIFAGQVHSATSVVVQEDLKIVVGGQMGYDFTLASFRENGSYDFGWGPGGQGYSIIDMGGEDYLSALTIAVGGWFYAAGSRTLSGNTDFAVAQILPSGSLATCSGFPCFNWSTGKAYANWGDYDAALAVQWRADGQVAVAGCAGGQIGWAQYSTRSSNAPWLGSTDMVGTGECAVGVGFLGSNQLMTAATQSFNGGENFALARFETSANPYYVGVEGEPGCSACRPAFHMSRAFPNPARGNIMIRFEVDQPQPVRIAVFDAAGRRLRTLANGPFSPGRHERAWDATDDEGRRVAPGAYFVRADASTGRASQRVLVLQ